MAGYILEEKVEYIPTQTESLAIIEGKFMMTTRSSPIKYNPDLAIMGKQTDMWSQCFVKC